MPDECCQLLDGEIVASAGVRELRLLIIATSIPQQDWHVDFAGSSVYYHVLRGSKVFYFIRPTAANLAAYEKWSGNHELQENTWLGDMVDRVYEVSHGRDGLMSKHVQGAKARTSGRSRCNPVIL